MEINSPFRYPGGKFYARKLIMELLPIHDFYIEPFAGGGSVFFAKEKVKENWLNDMDTELINCLSVIQKRPQDLIAALEGEAATKERHKYFKNEYQPRNQLERAKRWFYLNRTSYSGIMMMQNCFWGYGDKYSMRPENWPRNILRTSEKLKGVKLTSLDFEDVIDQAPDGAFLFLDPPYFNADQDKFYTHSFAKDDHFRLSDVLRRHADRLTYLITYDNSPEVREIYSWANHILEKEWNYTISRTDDQKTKIKRKGSRSKGREIFILNYGPSYQQAPLFDEAIQYAYSIA
ncbi:DNA adenine methylase [Candidatus Kaiserbacteria bacterium RIFCSPLOWO2_12_FULL_52_8]|uniref:site-specific DNA-methyltransferase (adenine-specific) n=1 Tax=Candidatus Kaiserbacteria bacterium RIFCSPHIGHO2_01_FULL_53_31 TaxID=1798481 RepID=A0A1F6CGQ8_9BACT|nr:MAG: DNA adenine methylase [Candidatus Kaiserbacteria bacterium RIFCSPHIGHO2_01_FULL_53_31]OGG94442.1 MAG: DNA adenine methylase [Candidatus Kaiserbacteria bacterium RIFCSPLOWO2_12_FULL_52_8]